MSKYAIWTLMHKNIPVADLELVERNATMLKRELHPEDVVGDQ